MDIRTLAVARAASKKLNNTQQYVTDAVDTYLAAHVDTSTGYVLDDTLQSTEAAAQAKAVSDALSEVESMLATDYSELTFPVAVGAYCVKDHKLYVAMVDIQDTETWDASHWMEVSASSEFVRTADIIASMHNGAIPLKWRSGYINTQSSPVSINIVSSSGFVNTIRNCAEGDVFTIGAIAGASTARAWAFVDSTGVILTNADKTFSTNTMVTITAPENAAMFIANNKLENCAIPSVFYGNAVSM